MIKNVEHKQVNIEKRKFEGKIRSIIFDALFICDIEHDKIQFELKMELNRIVEDLISDNIPKSQIETQPITDKLSITREAIETLHMRVMEAITDNLTNTWGIIDVEKLNLLSSVIFKIIQYEKSHRDEEKRLM